MPPKQTQTDPRTPEKLHTPAAVTGAGSVQGGAPAGSMGPPSGSARPGRRPSGISPSSSPSAPGYGSPAPGSASGPRPAPLSGAGAFVGPPGYESGPVAPMGRGVAAATDPASQLSVPLPAGAGRVTAVPAPPTLAPFGRGAAPIQQGRPTAFNYHPGGAPMEARGQYHPHSLLRHGPAQLAQEVADGSGMPAFGNEGGMDRPWRDERTLERTDGTKAIIQPKPPGPDFTNAGVHAQPVAPPVRLPLRSPEAQAELDAAARRAAAAARGGQGAPPGAGGAGGAGGPGDGASGAEPGVGGDDGVGDGGDGA